MAVYVLWHKIEGLVLRTWTKICRGSGEISPSCGLNWALNLSTQIALLLQSIITVRNSSCGKVMFSQASVTLSTWREMYTPPGRYPLGRHAQGLSPMGRHPCPRDSHCSGRYASLWNAFLLRNWNAAFYLCLRTVCDTNRVSPELRAVFLPH